MFIQIISIALQLFQPELALNPKQFDRSSRFLKIQINSINEASDFKCHHEFLRKHSIGHSLTIGIPAKKSLTADVESLLRELNRRSSLNILIVAEENINFKRNMLLTSTNLLLFDTSVHLFQSYQNQRASFGQIFLIKTGKKSTVFKFNKSKVMIADRDQCQHDRLSIELIKFGTPSKVSAIVHQLVEKYF